MNRPMARQELAVEPDFRLGSLDVRPSVCRVFSGEVEVRVEALTMSVLVVLARAAGATVAREELVNVCWQSRFVSDDAIARTISKVRLLARGVTPPPFILEVVPKVGYRLVAGANDIVAANEPSVPSEPMPRLLRSWLPAAVVATLLPIAFWLGTAYSRRAEPLSDTQPGAQPESANIHTTDIMDAILSLNEDRLAQYLREGWKVDWPLETQGSTALTWLPTVCQRDHTHDQAGLLKIAKLLVAAGADPAHMNKWNDTAYVIAREGRYCGPHHPVTEYLRSITPGAEADPVDKQIGARTP